MGASRRRLWPHAGVWVAAVEHARDCARCRSSYLRLGLSVITAIIVVIVVIIIVGIVVRRLVS